MGSVGGAILVRREVGRRTLAAHKRKPNMSKELDTLRWIHWCPNHGGQSVVQGKVCTDCQRTRTRSGVEGYRKFMAQQGKKEA